MKLEKNIIPEILHVAMVMDGNGRWANERALARLKGHAKGADRVRHIVRASLDMKVTHLTLFAFSTENWKRPKLEVKTLMQLLISSLKKEMNTLQKNNIQLNAIGNIETLPKKVFDELSHVIEATKMNSRMTLNLALSYGSRDELTHVVKEIGEKIKNNIISPEKIDESVINQHLYTRNLPDVDLLIRTSGEQRLSNFLLWQIAYAELYFTKVF